MSKKKATDNSTAHSCGHHPDSHCTTVDINTILARSCATCAARRLFEISRFVPASAIQKFIDINESNVDLIFNRLDALHTELREQARADVQEIVGSKSLPRTGDGVPLAEFADANRLQRVIEALRRFWAWKTKHSNKQPQSRSEKREQRRRAA